MKELYCYSWTEIYKFGVGNVRIRSMRDPIARNNIDIEALRTNIRTNSINAVLASIL